MTYSNNFRKDVHSEIEAFLKGKEQISKDAVRDIADEASRLECLLDSITADDQRERLLGNLKTVTPDEAMEQRQRILNAGKPVTAKDAAKAVSGLAGATVFVVAGVSGLLMVFIVPPFGFALLLPAFAAAIAR